MKTRHILTAVALLVGVTCTMSSPSHAAPAKSAKALGNTQNVLGSSAITLESISSTVAIVTVEEAMKMKAKPFARSFGVEATWKLVATGCRGITISGPTMIPAQTSPFTLGPRSTTSCVAGQTVVVFSYTTWGNAAVTTAARFAVDNSIKGVFRVELARGSSFVSISTSTKITEMSGKAATSQATLTASARI